MKKAIIVELVWTAGLLLGSFLLFKLIWGNSNPDVSMQDTYFSEGCPKTLLSVTWLVFLYFIVVGFFAYLIRAVVLKFKMIPVNIILLVFAGLFLYFSTFVSYSVDRFSKSIPFDASAPVKGLFYGCDISAASIWAPRLIKIFLLLILAFTSFMIGRNWTKPALK